MGVAKSGGAGKPPRKPMLSFFLQGKGCLNQVLAFMWLRTAMNYQHRGGTRLEKPKDCNMSMT